MLGKLLKYEIKATARSFLPLFGALLVFATINRLFYYGTDIRYDNGSNHWLVGMIFGIIVFIYVALIITVFVMTMIVTIQRFYKNLMGDEGYLMFTLPVSTWMLTTSKMLAAGIWSIASTAVTALSIFIMAAGSEFMRQFLLELPNAWAEISKVLGISGAAFTFEVIVFWMIIVFCGILPIYFSIAIGQLWQKHRIIGAFCAFIGINTVSQILASILVNVYFRFSGFYEGFNMTGPQGNTLMILIFLFSALFAAGCFVGTNLLLRKKLNLE